MVNLFYVDIILLCALVLILLRYLHKNKSKIHHQKIIAIGKHPLVSMIMVKTGWGLKFMNYWAKKHPLFMKVFAFTSVVIGFIGMLTQIALLFLMINMLFATPSQQQVSLVLPFTDVPGLGYLSFAHWIIAIIILASVHEFSHGVVARYFKIPVKSSGFAVLNVLLPLIPAAFVEPDEKKFAKEKPYRRYAVLMAGPVSNILLSIPFLLILVFVMTPVHIEQTEPVGFSFGEITQGLPANMSGVQAQQIYTQFNGVDVTNATLFFETIMLNTSVGDVIELGYYDDDGKLELIPIVTQASEQNASRAVIGVQGIFNERDFTESFKPYSQTFLWFEELVRWLFVFNLFIGLINLMPLYITDGGQIMHTICHQVFKKKETAMSVYKTVCNFSLIVIVAGLIVPLFF